MTSKIYQSILLQEINLKNGKYDNIMYHYWSHFKKLTFADFSTLRWKINIVFHLYPTFYALHWLLNDFGKRSIAQFGRSNWMITPTFRHSVTNIKTRVLTVHRSEGCWLYTEVEGADCVVKLRVLTAHRSGGCWLYTEVEGADCVVKWRMLIVRCWLCGEVEGADCTVKWRVLTARWSGGC